MTASITQPAQSNSLHGSQSHHFKAQISWISSLSPWFQWLPIPCEKSRIQTMPGEGAYGLGPAFLGSHISFHPSISFCSSSPGLSVFQTMKFVFFLGLCSCSFLHLDHSSSRSLHGCIHLIISDTDKTPLTFPVTRPHLYCQQLAITLPCFIFFRAFSNIWNDLSYLLVYMLTVRLLSLECKFHGDRDFVFSIFISPVPIPH